MMKLTLNNKIALQFVSTGEIKTEVRLESTCSYLMIAKKQIIIK